MFYYMASIFSIIAYHISAFCRVTRTGHLFRLFGHFGVRYPKENARCRDMPKSELDDPEAIFSVFLQDFEY